MGTASLGLELVAGLWSSRSPLAVLREDLCFFLLAPRKAELLLACCLAFPQAWASPSRAKITIGRAELSNGGSG